MIARVVAWSARHSGKVLLLALAVAASGIWLQRSLRRDVLPDLSDPQIVLVAEWMDHSALDVAAQVTDVLTNAVRDVPGTSAVRGQSMTGMAYVDVIFRSPSDVGPGRAAIVDRIERLRSRLPGGTRVQIGPEASSTGWVLQYLLTPTVNKQAMAMAGHGIDNRPGSLFWLRRFQDEVLRPALAVIPGVAEVASLGGDRQGVLIATTPDRLRGANMAFSDLATSVRAHVEASSATFEGLRGVMVRPAGGSASSSGGGVPLGRIAQIRAVPVMASGMADMNGTSTAVGGIVVAHRDANVERVVRAAREVIDRARDRLPPGVQLVVAYDRSELTARVQSTLVRAVAEEIVVVGLVALLFLLHARSAAIPMVTLPLVIVLTLVGMRLCGVPATIMSLGGIAIALGMAVDADLVALEACHRQIETEGGAAPGANRRAALIRASGLFAPPILISLLIAALAFLPVFAFGGESARLLRPLAITKTLVIGAAAICALTVAPALRDRWLRGRVVPELDNPITRALVRGYRPFVHFALSRPVFTLLTAALALASCLPLLRNLGGEFLPRIDEGALLSMPTTAPGIDPAEATDDLSRMDRAIAAHPAVAMVFGKAGRADTATDPAPYSMLETTIRLKPRSEWPSVVRHRWYSGWAGPRTKRWLGWLWPEESPATTAEIVDTLDRSSRLAGWTSAWTAPIRARLDMTSTGVRTEVGIRVVSGDQSRVDQLGSAARKAVLGVPGTKAAVYESMGGETRLDFAIDDEAVRRHGVEPGLVRAMAGLVLSGSEIGDVDTPTPAMTGVPGAAASRQRLPVRLSLSASVREPMDRALGNVTVRGGPDRTGPPVPLALLGQARVVSVPAQLRSEDGRSVGYVYVSLQANVDLATYVERARKTVEHALTSGEPRLRAGERVEWTGQYELMIAGQRRLVLIAVLVAVMMLGLLILQFRSLVQALIVLVSVPFALVGSVWTIFLLDYKLSAPVWVGLLSVVGLAMQTGVVMVVYIDDAFFRRLRRGLVRTRADIVAAHAEGTVLRLRPKLMTMTTMAAGLLPLLWADGPGSEIMRRVAAPMVGGLATSAFLTLEVLPVLYTIWRSRQLERALRTGRPIEDIAGVLRVRRRGSRASLFAHRQHLGGSVGESPSIGPVP